MTEILRIKKKKSHPAGRLSKSKSHSPGDSNARALDNL